MTINLSYLYLLSPLHTGGATQEGNLLGIARESHTDLPYIPSSTVRGRVRASVADEEKKKKLFGNTIKDVTTNGDSSLTQGSIWFGDGSILWYPVLSLSHGVVWISSPYLLKRWMRLKIHAKGPQPVLPEAGKFSGGNGKDLYLRDAILNKEALKPWSKEDWISCLPIGSMNLEVSSIDTLLVLPDQDCNVLIQTSLWRQVKVKLDEFKSVEEGSFRFEEAIPPDALMYFPWGNTVATSKEKHETHQNIFNSQLIWQFGGQESLGRGLVELWSTEA
jgi:CRISPR-associated protein Cmr4